MGGKGAADVDPTETGEWLDALDSVIREQGVERASFLLGSMAKEIALRGVLPSYNLTTPFRNTISSSEEQPLPGDAHIERRIRSLVRWNALAMVMRANLGDDDLGGHISTFSSCATLYDVGFNHFFRGSADGNLGDLIYFQGHSSPGIYARSFLEGRLSEAQLERYRREIGGEQSGLSSYPHPRLMPDYWQFPTVSMGLGPLMSIYQAHILKYLQARGLLSVNDRKVWTFCGDGEMDEPESLGAIAMAARENLDNLIFVVNCNLQRLDGPVRGNGKIMQELERVFRGAGWNVIKLVWGRQWDPLLQGDTDGRLQDIMDTVVDGELQNCKAHGGAYTREHFFGKDPEVFKRVEHLSDEDIYNLNRGGHDPYKVYSAFHRAVHHKGQPTVVLAMTIKGYGIGSREADNNVHQVKKLSLDNLRAFRDRFDIPISDEDLPELPYYHPGEDSIEVRYLKERRANLGGELPSRKRSDKRNKRIQPFADLLTGSGDRELSTTMALVRILSLLLKDDEYKQSVVPIVPDEARTFGMEGMFRQFGIYSSEGQLYTPEDHGQLTYYRESADGVMLEEGINEPGAMSAWIALATSHANNNLPMVPFYLFYSMFGFQRTHDLCWAAGDAGARGFLIGATSGRTTLNGEGLQHQDGHSHILASTIPTCCAYDPTYAYELSVIVAEGLNRMYNEDADCYYYITVGNENYLQPPMPEGEGIREGIVRGLYPLRTHERQGEIDAEVDLLGCGSILREVEAAAVMLNEQFGIGCRVWGAPGFNELRKDGLQVERWNRLHPQQEPKTCWAEQHLGTAQITVAATDYMAAYADQIRQWVGGRYTVLGTDGYGRSDTREKLRRFFEVNREHIVYSALYALVQEGKFDSARLQQVQVQLGIDPETLHPMER